MASNNNESNLVTLEEANQQAKEYLDLQLNNSHTWKDAFLGESQLLHDLDGNITSYLFTVNESSNSAGYIIVSSDKRFPGVLESTREGDSPYVNISGTDAIYIGPLMHLEKVDNGVVDVNKLLEILDENQLESEGIYSKENIDEASTNEFFIAPMTTTNYSYKLISGVPDYTWYLDCAPTSGANILTYWANNGYSKLNPSSTASLISTLATKFKTNSKGSSTVSNMESGMKSYITSKGYSATVTAYAGSFSRHTTEINAGYPSWVTTQDHPIWENHAMTGVGYEEFYDTSSSSWNRQLILHDTWYETPKDYYIKWSSYFDFVIKVRPS